MIFKTDAQGNAYYTVPRLIDMWPLLHESQDLVGDDRALYEALSTPSHEFDPTMLDDKKLAKKLGMTVAQVKALAESFDVRWIRPNLNIVG